MLKSSNQKKIKKSTLKGKNQKVKNNKSDQLQDKNDYEIQSMSINQEEQLQNTEQKYQKFQTPQQVKQKIAKNMLQKLNFNKNQNKKNDDFFIIDNNQNDDIDLIGNNKIKGEDTYEQQIAQQYKQQHVHIYFINLFFIQLRKQNKLYNTIDSRFQNLSISQPIQYKGHLQTITAIEVTTNNIFSCSKDRSIIKWDRQTGKKDFISLGKQLQHHREDIYCMALHSGNMNVLATAGEDSLIKLWDVRVKSNIGTLKGHRNAVYGVKFGIQSNILCSVSKDLTLKQWDVSQRGLMETFYQHNSQVLDIDHINSTDFITCGNDHQTIIWKTQNQTKVVYKGHDYAIDRVRSLNQQRFVTASMDGSIHLWHAKRNKAVFKNHQAHNGWISALDTLKQTNMFVSGGTDKMLKLWAIEPQMKGMRLIKNIEMKGIVTDVKLGEHQIVATQCQEHRLGRWITEKTRNKIKIFKFKNQS